MRCRHRGMAAQVHFGHRCEPAQMIIILFPGEKCRLGEIILRGDLQECFVWQPFFERTNTGRVAAERIPSESVNLVIWNPKSHNNYCAELPTVISVFTEFAMKHCSCA